MGIKIIKKFRNIYDFKLFNKHQHHIGLCKLMIDNNQAIINNIYINNLYKKQGHGSYLLQETEKIVKKDFNIKKISLLCWQPSGSFNIVGFYQKNGYIISNIHNGYYDDYVNLFDLYHLYKII